MAARLALGIPAAMPPSAPKIKDCSDHYENYAVDRHHLMGCVSESVGRIRFSPKEMPNKQRYSREHNNYPAGLHNSSIIGDSYHLAFLLKHYVMNCGDLEPDGSQKGRNRAHEHYISRHSEPNNAGWPDENRNGGHRHSDKSKYNAVPKQPIRAMRRGRERKNNPI